MSVNESSFDVEQFMKKVRLFDSANAGESGNAIRAALKHVADANLSFVDALRWAFSRDDEVKSEIRAGLEEEYRERMDAAADEINTQAEAISSQESEIERLREQLRQTESRHPARTSVEWGDFQLSSIAWGWPSALTIALGIVSVITWTVPAVSEVLWPSRFLLFAVWAVIVWRMESPRIFWLKTMVWIACWYAVVLVLDVWARDASHAAVDSVLVPWLLPSPIHPTPLRSLCAGWILVFAVAVNLSPLSMWLTNEERHA